MAADPLHQKNFLFAYGIWAFLTLIIRPPCFDTLKTKSMPQGTPKPPPVVSAHQPHDKLFKALFKTPAHVQEVLNACAPQALLDVLLLDSLRVTDASFVDPNLAGGIADIVLECQTSSGSRAFISFILEHKSTVPRHAPY